MKVRKGAIGARRKRNVRYAEAMKVRESVRLKKSSAALKKAGVKNYEKLRFERNEYKVGTRRQRKAHIPRAKWNRAYLVHGKTDPMLNKTFVAGRRASKKAKAQLVTRKANKAVTKALTRPVKKVSKFPSQAKRARSRRSYGGGGGSSIRSRGVRSPSY